MWEFMMFVNKKYGSNFKSYHKLYTWSIDHPDLLWEAIWNFCDIIHSDPFTQVVDNIYQMPGAKWFKSSKLNFAENF